MNSSHLPVNAGGTKWQRVDFDGKRIDKKKLRHLLQGLLELFNRQSLIISKISIRNNS